MAETPLKRQREETQVNEEEESKRYKSYDHIISFLETDEYEPNQDLSSLISTLQQELSPNLNSDPLPEPSSGSKPDIHAATTTTTSGITTTLNDGSSSGVVLKDEEDKARIVRNLSEASNDELGIPFPETDIKRREYHEDEQVGFNSGELGAGMIPLLYNELWEFEDEAANYYTLMHLQPEFFI